VGPTQQIIKTPCATPHLGGPFWGGGGWAVGPKKILTIKNKLVKKCHKGPRALTGSLDKQHKLRKLDMRFGIWNVRSVYKAGLLMTVVN
jgi:hypothetical protein